MILPDAPCFKVYLVFMLLISIILQAEVYVPKDTVNVLDYYDTGKEGNLNQAVKTVNDFGKLSSTIFILKANGYYVLTDSIWIPEGEHLTMIAPDPGSEQDSAPPQILCSTNKNDIFFMDYLFYCSGDITLKNIWLYHANTEGKQIGVPLLMHHPSDSVKQRGIFENVIFDYSSLGQDAGGAITVKSKHFTGHFTNCYWKNCTNATFRYYGRAISFPFMSTEWHIDSLFFENCTFANIGYVLMQEGGEYSDYVRFNHCTFLNTLMYTMQSGWWYNLSLTNSIFVNAHMMGHTTRSGYEPHGGTVKIDSVANFGFDVPFSEQNRRILFTTCSYGIEKWLQDYMWNNWGSVDARNYGDLDRIPHPQPMMNQTTIDFFESDNFPYMNKADLYNPSFPGFIHPPSDTVKIKEFLVCDWWAGCDIQWEWKPQNSLNRLWPLEEDLAYTNDTLLTAGMGGFPLGDLYRWFPQKYQEWKSQSNGEDARISTWLETGIDPGEVGFHEKVKTDLNMDVELYQNYPNPFNSTTEIRYQISENSPVRLAIYDVLGKELDVLVQENKTAGCYTVTWDTNSLVSGIYFCTLQSGSFIKTHKMIFIK